MIAQLNDSLDRIKKQFETTGVDLISYINEPDNSKFTFTLYRRNCCLTKYEIATTIHTIYATEYYNFKDGSTMKFRYHGDHFEFIEVEICNLLNNNYVEFLDSVSRDLYRNIFEGISNIISEL